MENGFQIRVNNFLVQADDICDAIPVVSTLSNLIGLFQKFVVIPLMSRSAVHNSHYYTYLNDKKIFRCIILLVPVIGNILVVLTDWSNPYQKCQYKNRDEALAAVRQNGMNLLYAGLFRYDKGIVLAAIQQDGLAISYAGPTLRNNLELATAAVTQNSGAFGWISREMQNNQSIASIALSQNPLLWQELSPDLRNNHEMRQLYQKIFSNATPSQRREFPLRTSGSRT